MNTPLWYLAAPFFNPSQKAVVTLLEKTFAEFDVPFISPRQQHTDPNEPGIPTDEKAAIVFQQNIDDLDKATGMFMVCDFLLPPGQELHVVETLPLKSIFGPLKVPDTGAIFELGNFWRKAQDDMVYDMPIIGYFHEEPTRTFNVMLSQAFDGFVYGPDNLRRFAKRLRRDGWDPVVAGKAYGLARWKGGHG